MINHIGANAIIKEANTNLLHWQPEMAGDLNCDIDLLLERGSFTGIGGYKTHFAWVAMRNGTRIFTPLSDLIEKQVAQINAVGNLYEGFRQVRYYWFDGQTLWPIHSRAVLIDLLEGASFELSMLIDAATFHVNSLKKEEGVNNSNENQTRGNTENRTYVHV